MCFKVNDLSFPKDSPEELGCVVGFAENVGHAMTFKTQNGNDKWKSQWKLSWDNCVIVKPSLMQENSAALGFKGLSID